MDRTVVAAVGDGCYLMMRLRVDDRGRSTTSRSIWVIFNDGEFKLIKLYQLSAFFMDSGLVEFDNPDYVAYARACGADGYSVDRRSASSRTRSPPRSPPGRPTLIDARITRLALPNYSPNPEGVLAAIWSAYGSASAAADGGEGSDNGRLERERPRQLARGRAARSSSSSPA